MSFPTGFFQPNRALQWYVPGTCEANLPLQKAPLVHRSPALWLGSSDIQRCGEKEKLAHSFFLPQRIIGNASENGRDPLAFPSHCGYSRLAPRASNLTAVGTDNPHGETKMQNHKHPLGQTIFLMAPKGHCK